MVLTLPTVLALWLPEVYLLHLNFYFYLSFVARVACVLRKAVGVECL